jgi:hypothetical protein
MGSGEDSPDPSFFTILIVTRMTMRRTVLTICVTSLFLLAPTARSWRDNRSSTQIPRTPLACTDNAHRQFDFWVGNWDVFDVERPTVVVAHARVELILNACVLHEVYESVDGHKGESFSIYDATRDTWHQSWVNDHGYLLTIEGRLHGEAMILRGVDHLPDGTLRTVRGEWRSEDRGVREAAVRSTDGGVTWLPWFDILFLPHKPTASPSGLLTRVLI